MGNEGVVIPIPTVGTQTAWRHELLSTCEGRVSAYLTDFKPGRQNIVLVNALGFPASIFQPIGERLSCAANVITWDQRGIPDQTGGALKPPSIDQHAADLLAIANHLQLDSITLMGFCNGAEIALAASLKSNSQSVNKIVLTNGFFSFNEKEVTPSTRALLILMKRIRERPELAEKYYEVLSRTSEEQTGVPSEISKFPFMYGAENICRMSEALLDSMENHIESWIKRVDAPVDVLMCGRDDISHPQESARIAELLKQSSLISMPDAEHFAIYSDPHFRNELCSILLREQQSKSDRKSLQV